MHTRRVMPIIIPRLEDPSAASVDERDEHLMLLEAARQSLDVEWTGTLAAAETAGDHDVMGYPSMVAFLKHRMRMAGGRAHRYVRNARMAAKFRATLSAWVHRQISGDEAELMFRAAEWTPGQLSLGGDVLLELPGVVLDAEEQMARRHFDVTRRNNGMVAGEFELPTLEGEAFLSAVDTRMPPPADGDDRTTTQRPPIAFGVLARDALESPTAPVVGGERPHINLHADLAALQGRPAVSMSTKTDSCSIRSPSPSWPATPRCRGSSSSPAPKSSTSVARPGWSRQPCVGRGRPGPSLRQAWLRSQARLV